MTYDSLLPIANWKHLQRLTLSGLLVEDYAIICELQCMNEWTIERTNEQTNERTNERTNEQMKTLIMCQKDLAPSKKNKVLIEDTTKNNNTVNYINYNLNNLISNT